MFKVGDRIKVPAGECIATNRDSVIPAQWPETYGRITGVEGIWPRFELDNGQSCFGHAGALEIIKEKEMKYKVGDKLERTGPYSTTTVTVIGTLFNKVYGVIEDDPAYLMTEKELEDFKLVNDNEKELTLEEIADKFKINVKDLRIKE